MDHIEVENEIKRFEVEQSLNLFRDKIEGLNEIDTLPIDVRIKLMLTIGKAYGYGSKKPNDESSLDIPEWFEIYPELLSQCVIIAEKLDYVSDKSIWENDFFKLLSNLDYDGASNDDEENLKDLVRICAYNKKYEICEHLVNTICLVCDDYFEDTDTFATILPFCSDVLGYPEYAPADAIAESYKIYEGTDVIDQLKALGFENTELKKEIEKKTVTLPRKKSRRKRRFKKKRLPRMIHRYGWLIFVILIIFAIITIVLIWNYINKLQE